MTLVHMKPAFAAIAVCAATAAFAGGSSGPRNTSSETPIPAPKDRAYPGEIRLAVDASDLERRIVRVHEHLTGIDGRTVLLYPKWLPGHHAPEGPIARFAGLRITANGEPVSWMRDPVDVYAFRVQTAPGLKSIDIDFEYLSPTSAQVGKPEVSRDLLLIEWNAAVLYPAGYFARQIPVEASLTLPVGWTLSSALEGASANGTHTTFKRANLDTLVDSPVYAGRYALRLDLDPGGSVPVHLDLFADRPELLAVKPEQLGAYRALVQQAYKLVRLASLRALRLPVFLERSSQAQRARTSSVERGRQRPRGLCPMG